MTFTCQLKIWNRCIFHKYYKFCHSGYLEGLRKTPHACFLTMMRGKMLECEDPLLYTPVASTADAEISRAIVFNVLTPKLLGCERVTSPVRGKCSTEEGASGVGWGTLLLPVSYRIIRNFHGEGLCKMSRCQDLSQMACSNMTFSTCAPICLKFTKCCNIFF